MANPAVQRFSEFHEKWNEKLEDILQQLTQVSDQRTEVVKTEEELLALVSTVTTHLKEYYNTKWAAAGTENVLIFFSPPWMNPLEHAQLWMTGWKPSTVFRQLENLKKKGNVFVMTEEQEKRMEDLKVRVRMEEDKVEREMERQHVAMADRKMVQLSKISTSRPSRGGPNSVTEVAVKEVVVGLERVMKASDCVRLKTLKGVLDLLSPMQGVDFLAMNITTQLRFRQWGTKKKDTAGTALNGNQDK
ncbi:protein DOG1-like 4 [Vigna unguiculata]|uniref:Transcription factor TGA n=1 Tax=Vigna unguiculata TaxID=3917 RepID=A0A4D6KGH7_VIGUN|nr:protein DOG1-like 4 [Vigna unguiculata]QCD76866.1 transcription factor TGA [Vigna unguiculata]